MFKSIRRLTLIVLICFVMSSFLADLTIFPAEAKSFTQTETSGENSLAFSEEVYSSKNTSVLDDVYTTPAPESSEIFRFPIGTKISDAISHPTEPVIFAVDSANSLVYSVNVQTGTVREVYVGGSLERMDYFNDELFVTVLTGFHSSSRKKEDQSGAIAVIDTTTMKLKEIIDIDIDPYEIVAGRDGYLYIPSGSGEWTYFNSYSRSTKELTDSKPVRQKSLIEYHPILNKIYIVTTDLTPTDYEAFDIDNGEFVANYDSIYHGDYSLNTYSKISPDGKYLFNGTGCIFTCSEDKNRDMRFFFKLKLNYDFFNIAFDLDHNLFFTSLGTGQIDVYDYNTFQYIHSVNSKGKVSKLFYLDGKLIALSNDGEGQLILENINIDNVINNLPTPTPTPTATSIPITSKDPFAQLHLNMVVKDSVIHPDNDFIYMINGSDELVKINFVTGDMLSVSLGYTSNCIAFGNGEIYVGFGSQGMIGIYDADTLQYRDKIMVGDILSDVAVGHDGYIYISPEDNRIGTPYVRSFSRETKQEVSQLLLHKTGYLEPNPVNNSFVLSSMYVSPTDLYTIKYDNGKLIEQYDSPYHGDYKIGWRNRICCIYSIVQVTYLRLLMLRSTRHVLYYYGM